MESDFRLAKFSTKLRIMIFPLLSLVEIFFLILITLMFIINSCQSRVVSRLTGTALKLRLPDDFDKPISFSSGRKGEKDLFYFSSDGQMKVKTYTDWSLMESEIVFVTE